MLTLLQSVFTPASRLVLFALLFLPALVSLVVVCAVYFSPTLFQRFQGRGWPQRLPLSGRAKGDGAVAIRSEQRPMPCLHKRPCVGRHSSKRGLDLLHS